MNTSPVRWQVIFRGTVQGVGFRYHACRVARAMSIDGWVRNRPDGSVEMVAEGAADQIRHLVEQVSQSCGVVNETEITDCPTTGDLDGFDIRF